MKIQISEGYKHHRIKKESMCLSQLKEDVQSNESNIAHDRRTARLKRTS